MDNSFYSGMRIHISRPVSHLGWVKMRKASAIDFAAMKIFVRLKEKCHSYQNEKITLKIQQVAF
jgi:hypothetical protein